MPETSVAQTTNRIVRSVDVQASHLASVSNAVEEMYDDTLDVVVVRGALPRTLLEAAGERLDRDDENPGWARPNERMPVEDIQLLGTDTPATPTYQAPSGASLDAYLASAERHEGSVSGVFAAGFDAAAEFGRVLGRLSGGRRVEVATTVDGRRYVPFTIRRLTDGRQSGLHHDYHYPLALYSDLAPRVDTTTLVSFVAMLRRPDAGGELFVYAATPTTPDPPKMPNGFSWDLEGVERRFHSAKFEVDEGDLFLLASGRCLHRVAPIQGSRARVTMGGFLALDKTRQRVFYWS